MPKDFNAAQTGTANKVFDLPIFLEPGQVNTLSFPQESISSMHLLPKGELEISFLDGSKVIVENFEELANSAQSCGRDTLIQLSDNTIIYPDELKAQLAEGPVTFAAQNAGSDVVAFMEPKAGQISEYTVEAGREYKLGFALSDTVSAAQAGQNLILTFKDGGVLILNNYFSASQSELPPVMTLADGSTVDTSALLTSCKLVEIPTVAQNIETGNPELAGRQTVPDIEPAAGEEDPLEQGAGTAKHSAVKKQSVADIEPAAGDESAVANVEPAAGDAGNNAPSRGYGFSSSLDSVSLDGKNPIGPIAPTALRYEAPRSQTIPNLVGLVGAPTPVDYKPSLSGSEQAVDETTLGSVSGSVSADFGGDGPGAFGFNTSFVSGGSQLGGVLTSGGEAVTVTLVGNTYTGATSSGTVFTLVIDSATGAYSFTQLKTLDHADKTNPNDSITLTFGVTGTDSDGDVGTTTISIAVLDDGPVALDDSAFVGSLPLTVSGNVLTNDQIGNDGHGKVVSVTFAGVVYDVPAAGSVLVAGVYGTLSISSDGTYTYTSLNTALGSDVFSYTMVDYDGDPSTANLSVTVNDLDTLPTITGASSQVDETNMSPTVTVSGDIVADFKADGPGSFAFGSSFTAGGSLLGGSLTSNGVPVVVSHTGTTYTGVAGGNTVFTVTLDAETGHYVYTQFAALDHADGANANDVITLSFAVEATDSDGDGASTTLVVGVVDDAPLAHYDEAVVDPITLTVSGNVTDNDSIGHDLPGYIVKTITFGVTSVTIPTSGTATIHANYGTLTIGSNGAYTYTSANSSVGRDVFTYTIVDRDGDVSSAQFDAVVEDIDTIPVIVDHPQSVDETQVDESGLQTITGTVDVDYRADGPGTLALTGAASFSATGSLAGGSLTSNGVPVVVTQAGNQYFGQAGTTTIFTLTLNPDGTYVFQQLGPLDHADANDPDDVIDLHFGVTATDSDGDTADGTITINVHDDAPTAHDDGNVVADANIAVSGNVLANDKIGNDEPGHGVTKVQFGAVVVDVPSVGTATVVGAYGTLTIGKDGAYTYLANGTTQGSDIFTYTIKDQDGDTASARLSIGVQDIDDHPCGCGIFFVVDETDLGTSASTLSGVLAIDYGADGPGVVAPVAGSFTAGGSLLGGSLTSNGVPVVVSLVGNQYIGKAGALSVFTLDVNADGTYSFKLLDQLDHADGSNANDVITLGFGFKATDSDGDAASGTITVSVKDDAPIAVNDTATLASAPGSVSGNVTGNDTVGADQPGYVVKEVSFGGTITAVPTSGTVTIAGAHGNLTIGRDGSYTYTGSSVGGDVFSYKIVDRDGDSANATLTITVADIDTQPSVQNAAATVDETGMPSAAQTISGTLSVDYRADGPGVVAPVAGSFTAGGSLLGGSLTSNGVPVVVSLVGNQYIGKAGALSVFTLDVNADGTYSFKLLDQLDHADGSNANDVITLGFGFKATDSDGDAASGTITVSVKDDAPIAVNDTATLASAPGSVSGNVTGNDTVGADQPGYVVKEVSFGGTITAVPTSGTVTIAGAHGNLTIGRDGSYTYTGSSVGGDVFSYKIVDRDGDSANATLTITVADIDTQPSVQNAAATVDETGMPSAAQTISGTLSVDYRADGPGVVAPVAGSFTAGGSLLGGSLTSNGVPVVVSLVGNQYIGKAGALSVFTLDVNADGTYSFKLLDQLDHADGSNANDVITLGFGFKATDSDGDAASGTITVSVKDDAPIAVNDTATLASAPGSVSGNVTGNDTVGADQPGYVVKEVSFGGTITAVPTSGTVTIAGAHGNLTIGRDGSYTYTGSSVGGDVFSYKIVDRDGDSANATLTITVADIDTQPSVQNAAATVDETGMPSAAQTISGTLSVDYRADGPGVVAPVAGSFTAGGSLLGGSLTSNGVPVVVSLVGNQYIGKAGALSVFTLDVNADGTYSFKLLDQLDHADGSNANDVITLGFGFKATDSDGDAASGTITVSVKDDAPIAVNDTATLASAPGSVSGNVTGNDTVGADQPGYVVKEVSFGGTITAVPTSGTVTIAGAHGNLTIGRDGSYTYTGSSVGGDVFSYKIVDRDGDSANATLTITVADIDTQPSVQNAAATVDETGMPSSAQIVSGTLSVDYRADGPGVVAPVAGSFTAGGSLLGGSLTSNGVPVVVSLVGNQYIGKAGALSVFTLDVNADGTYSFKLLDQLDHADGSNANDVITLGFGFKATDSDGDAASGTITVSVKDDAPIAVNDTATLASAPGSVSGNVTGNDTVGADQPGYVVKEVSFGGTITAVPTSGTVTIAGAHGNLTIGRDGSYTYTGSSVGGDVFSYKIVDRDGDSANATLTITVADIDTEPCVENAAATVDETGMPSSAQIVSGTLSVDYRADGPGVVAPVAGSFTAGGSLLGGSLTSNGVPVVVSLVGNQYIGKAGALSVFTLDVNADGTYSFKLLDQLDHADGSNANDVITLGFGFKATDSDGDAASGTITVSVKDDAPIAVNDTATLASAPGSVSGNVTGNDTVGADQPGYVVKEVSFGGTITAVPTSGTVTIAGAHGNLTIGRDGSYTYTGSSVGGDVFSYKIVDRDGDSANATLTITVADIDTQPSVQNAAATVDETGMPSAAQTISGTLSVDYRADGPGVVAPVAGSFTAGGSLLGGSLTSNGVPVVVSLVGNQYIGKAGALSVFTLDVNADGTYSFKLLDQLDHADGSNANDVITLGFGFKATDSDGDAASGTITVSVKDDAPIAVNDTATLASAPGSVSGNVTGNDTVGADQPGYVVKEVSFGGTITAVPTSGTVTIAGAHGNLTIGRDGSYTYTGSSVGGDVFSYKIVDRDGDSANATLTITVADIDTEPCVENAAATVDETGMPSSCPNLSLGHSAWITARMDLGLLRQWREALRRVALCSAGL
jgi:T1SS-143 domain-containing protein